MNDEHEDTVKNVGNDLPIDWTEATLNDACNLITDGTHFSPPNSSQGDFMYVTAKNIRKWGLDLSDITFISESVHKEIYARCPVEIGDVLYIKDGATTGIAAINHISEPFSLLSSVALLKPNIELLNPKYLKHWLNSPAAFKKMTADMTGTAIKRLVLRQIRSTEIPLPPLAEQIRIADKLDALLARVDAGRERLERVPKLLKRFRQSVLSAAVSGELTREWRGGGDAEWERVTVRELATDIRYGTAQKCDYDDTGLPVLRIPNVSGGVINTSDLKYAKFDNAEINKLSLKAGDLLVIRSNGSADLVGQPALVMPQHEGFLFAGYLIRLRFKPEANPHFLWHRLSAPDIRSTIETQARSSSGVHNINTEELRQIEVRLPPLSEQGEIVRRVEALFAIADRIEQRYASALASFNRLTPALLAKAFRGELVPQDPNDEPASVLLERIRAQRAAQGAGVKRGRKPGKVSEDGTEPRKRGRPPKAQAEAGAVAAESKRRGRPPKMRPGGTAVPVASSYEDAVRKLEAQKLERAQGSRQVGLFEE